MDNINFLNRYCAFQKIATFQHSKRLMHLLIGVILFVLRSTFLFGIDPVDTLKLVSSTPEELEVSIESNQNEFNPFLLEESEIEVFLIENREDKKTEFEYLPLPYSERITQLIVSTKGFSNWETSFFSTKPKREGLHLYDLFHSWKSYSA
jgi:hypothetical protein